MLILFDENENLTKYGFSASVTAHEQGVIYNQVEMITIKDLIPLIGKELYQNIATKYKNKQLNEIESNLVSMCQNMLMALVTDISLPVRAVNQTADSISVRSSETQQPASEPRLRDLQSNARLRGWIFAEQLLAFLQENEESFVIWKNSEQNLERKRLFFRNARELNAYFNINNYEQTYFVLLPILNEVEREYLQPILGQKLYEEIKSQWEKGILYAKNKYLIENFILSALAHQAHYLSVVRFNFSFSVENIRITIHNYKMVDSKIDQSRTDNILNLEEKEAQNAFGRLRNYLEQNYFDYPLYQPKKTEFVAHKKIFPFYSN